MKKSLLAMTALAAMLFAGCTSSDELTTLESIKKAENAPTPVSFGTYMGRTGTRAGQTGIITTDGTGGTTQSLQSGKNAGTKGFGVMGYQHTAAWSTARGTATPNFMYNQQVYYDGGWKYEPLKYWPNGNEAANGSTGPSNSATSTNTDKLSFFAYAPYVDKTSAITGVGITKINGSSEAIATETDGKGKTKVGEPTIDFTLSTSDIHTAANVDLLWGTRNAASGAYNETDGTNAGVTAYNTDLTKQTVSETVDFLFKHALAKIGGKNGLKIVADVDGNGAGLGGFGTLDSKTCITVRSITIKNIAANVKVSGEFNLATGEWSNLTNAAPTPTLGSLINENIKDGTDDSDASTTDIVMNTEIYNSTGAPSYSSGWTPLGVTTTAKDVYNAEQDAFYMLPGSSLTLQVVIDYDITTYDTNISGNYVKINQAITNEVTIDIPDNATNKFYTLVLHLGLTSVKFSAEVANWDDAGAGAVEEVWLPSNVIENSTSVSLAAGSGATVNTAAGTTSYTINLTNLNTATGNTFEVTRSNETMATAASATKTDGQSTGTCTVTLASNSGAVRNCVVTIVEKDSSANVLSTTTVTIIQAAP